MATDEVNRRLTVSRRVADPSVFEAQLARMPLQQARRVEIGSRLRDARKGAKLSLADVAQEIKLSKQAVSAWESGRTTLDALQLGNLALLYGVSADFLLFGIKTIPEDLKAIYSKARNA